jgi:hypothetical protein
MPGGRPREQGSTFFLEKRSKNLLFFRIVVAVNVAVCVFVAFCRGDRAAGSRFRQL